MTSIRWLGVATTTVSLLAGVWLFVWQLRSETWIGVGIVAINAALVLGVVEALAVVAALTVARRGVLRATLRWQLVGLGFAVAFSVALWVSGGDTINPAFIDF